MIYEENAEVNYVFYVYIYSLITILFALLVFAQKNNDSVKQSYIDEWTRISEQEKA